MVCPFTVILPPIIHVCNPNYLCYYIYFIKLFQVCFLFHRSVSLIGALLSFEKQAVSVEKVLIKHYVNLKM